MGSTQTNIRQRGRVTFKMTEISYLPRAQACGPGYEFHRYGVIFCIKSKCISATIGCMHFMILTWELVLHLIGALQWPKIESQSAYTMKGTPRVVALPPRQSHAVPLMIGTFNFGFSPSAFSWIRFWGVHKLYYFNRVPMGLVCANSIFFYNPTC